MNRNDAPASSAGAPRPRVAFVLSGGGALGSVQVGVLDALIGIGLRPDLIVGTSVGALNGAWLAAHPDGSGVRRLSELWRSIDVGSVFTGGQRRALLRLLLGRDHLFSDKGLRELVSRNVGDMRFEDLKVPFYVTATDIDTGELAVLDRGPLLPAILASTAIPGIFPPVRLDGHQYVDGGILSHCSIETAWRRGATHIVVIECPNPPPASSFGIAGPVARAFWASIVRLCRLEVERFGARCATLMIAPDFDLGPYQRYDFSRTGWLIERAREWTYQFIQSDGHTFFQKLRLTRSAQADDAEAGDVDLAHLATNRQPATAVAEVLAQKHGAAASS
ncbi:MAG: patatin-like phospholipase family protein [Chloroflexi bacterium]|nr:patatin-like phospholipase family protein [Chloroflexota bacterium]